MSSDGVTCVSDRHLNSPGDDFPYKTRRWALPQSNRRLIQLPQWQPSDTNVLISAVLFGGVPGRLVDAVREGGADGIVSLHVLSEFVDVLTRPRLGIDEATAMALAEEIASFTEVIPLMHASGSWVIDRADDPVVEAALLARATHIVTGDARIHEVELVGVAVVTPADAVRALEAQDKSASRQ